MSLAPTLRTIVTSPRRHDPPGDAMHLSAVDIEAVRYPGELEAAETLRRTKGFKAALRDVEMSRARYPVSISKLDTQLRLDEKAAPAAFEALGHARRALGFDGPIEVFQSGGTVNASMAATERGAALTLEGPVLEILSPLQLRGLIGHELAHYICHSGPTARLRSETWVSLKWCGQYEGSEDERAQALGAGALGISQEITADRFEVLLSQDLRCYLATSLKFGTELHDAVVLHDPDVLLRQAREVLAHSTGDVDRRNSHPERHLRVRATELFYESDLFHRLTGAGPGTRPIAEVNSEIARLLTGWVPKGADHIEQGRFERFLLALGAAIVSADGAFTRGERRFLARALPSAFHDKLPLRDDALVAEVAEELARSGDQRALLTTLNFLCGLVEADGRVSEEELRAIDHVGKTLKAKELFRRELTERFSFDAQHFRQSTHQRADEDVGSASESLRRYLDTVVLKGKRSTTLARLLSLAGAHDSKKARRSLESVLVATALKAKPPVDRAELKARIVLKAVEVPKEGEGLPLASGRRFRDNPCMAVVTIEHVDIASEGVTIRAALARPKGREGRLPAVVCWSDIFQLTPSHMRVVSRLASHGFLVLAPELYGRVEPAGTVLDFERARQRALDDAARVELSWVDADRKALLAYLTAHPSVDAARLGAMGFCFGGHLSFRAAAEPQIKAAVCFYPTGVHDGSLGACRGAAGTLALAPQVRGELLLVWGRQDPHIPPAGRAAIHRALDDAGVRYEARLFDAEHAFLRDEGPRHDAEAGDRAFAAAIELLRRALG